MPVTVGTETVNAEPFEAQRPAATYPVRVNPVAGAEVSAPDSVTVRKGETAVVRSPTAHREAETAKAHRG